MEQFVEISSSQLGEEIVSLLGKLRKQCHRNISNRRDVVVHHTGEDIVVEMVQIILPDVLDAMPVTLNFDHMFEHIVEIPSVFDGEEIVDVMQIILLEVWNVTPKSFF